jgi:hypothetical protein
VGIDGAVQPCFFHPAIGSTRMDDLDQVLNAGPAQNFRDTLDIARDPTCRQCVCSLDWQPVIL